MRVGTNRSWTASAALFASFAVCAACGHGGRLSNDVPRPTSASVPVAARLASDLGACAEPIRRQLVAGQSSRHYCADDVGDVGRREIARQGLVFGVVHEREVDLVSLRLGLSRALRCKRWPLRTPGEPVLGVRAAHQARCHVRPFRGVVDVVAVRADGSREPGVYREAADEQGRLSLEFSRVDEALRAQDLGGLDEFVRLELGTDGWAGSVDLRQLRRFLAQWHLKWVSSGRGAPALFTSRHPEHPGRGDADALALEVRVERQKRDYKSVVQGTLGPASFLERHVWSPFRHSVQELLGESTPAPKTGEATAASSAEPRASATAPCGARLSDSAPAGQINNGGFAKTASAR